MNGDLLGNTVLSDDPHYKLTKKAFDAYFNKDEDFTKNRYIGVVELNGADSHHGYRNAGRDQSILFVPLSGQTGQHGYQELNVATIAKSSDGHIDVFARTIQRDPNTGDMKFGAKYSPTSKEQGQLNRLTANFDNVHHEAVMDKRRAATFAMAMQDLANHGHKVYFGDDELTPSTQTAPSKQTAQSKQTAKSSTNRGPHEWRNAPGYGTRAHEKPSEPSAVPSAKAALTEYAQRSGIIPQQSEIVQINEQGEKAAPEKLDIGRMIPLTTINPKPKNSKR